MLRPRPWRRPVAARAQTEGHRQASWLELFFDLSFVVAVAQAAVQLEHALAEGHPGDGIVGYMLIFAAIWWAWMAFTWFANVFDTDDVPYRLLMMVMIAGSLGLAAGVPQIAVLDFRIGVLSYVVMRLAYVAQWLRVLRTGDPTWRPVALKMSVLTTFNQIGWVLFLFVPLQWRVPVFLVWFAADIATPWIAGWDARMGGHKGHIVERYGLFTIIVLGESIAAATVAVGQAVEAQAASLPLLALAAGGLVIVFSLWWIYFEFSTGRAPGLGRSSQFIWGYGHYFVFAAIAAIGAGLALSVEWITDQEHVALSARGVALTVGVSVAALLTTIGIIEWTAEHAYTGGHVLTKLGGAAFAVVAAYGAPALTVPGSVLAIGAMLAAMVVYGVTLQHRLHVRARDLR
jgi:low temperature requirement protein LtrA